MDYIQRLFYDLHTGGVIFWYWHRCENLIVSDIGADFEIHSLLRNRSLEDTGYFEWLEVDSEMLQKLTSDKYQTSVDIVSIPHQLVFTEIPQDNIPASPEDYETALEELGVINNDN